MAQVCKKSLFRIKLGSATTLGQEMPSFRNIFGGNIYATSIVARIFRCQRGQFVFRRVKRTPYIENRLLVGLWSLE